MRIAIIGMGLIGGSVALRLRDAMPDADVAGFDPDAGAARAATDRGAVTEWASSAAAAVRGADVVVLALPVDRIPAACRDVAAAVEPDAVVTDVGSAKADVVAAGEGAFGGRFVGGHPMAGSERHGMDAAHAGLFDDAWWILTPTPTTSSAAYATVAQLVSALGARPVAVAPEVHDGLVARLSHVPQLAASAVVAAAAAGGGRGELLHLAGAGFRDVTRIAASNPDTWVGIVRANRPAVLEALRRFRDRLDDVDRMVAGGRWDELGGWLAAARRARLELLVKPAWGGQPVTLGLPVPDRPGVLADVAGVAASLGVNLEDVRIVHSTEGGRGRIELVVDGDASADLLAKALRDAGHLVERSAVDVASS
ncbi:MAG TPA: prephenate dehydrogenase/arogenate dehydrogenase family protein [Actinomycetota bacterium]|nr:prephenate dehydrogenase/arogenate dehydrogenase family protein [Actinomycetota bacterium]